MLTVLEAGSQRPGCQHGQVLASSLVCAHVAFLWCLCAKRKSSGVCSSSYKGTNLIRLGTHPYDVINFMTFSKALSPRMDPLKIRASIHEFGMVEGNRNIHSIALSFRLFPQGATGVILLEYKADLMLHSKASKVFPFQSKSQRTYCDAQGSILSDVTVILQDHLLKCPPAQFLAFLKPLRHGPASGPLRLILSAWNTVSLEGCKVYPSTPGHLFLCVPTKLLQSCPNLCHPMDCNPPSSSVQGILQARTLEWVVMSSFWGSSQPRDRTCVSCISCIGRRVLYHQCHPGSPLLSKTLLSFY